MANPTTYFGWVMPTATDLVTDLPADFNVFGQGVDTSMQDLLGGTTGQVLSKTSNTNMDFTWITPDDSNAIQNAIVDAKGDLIGAAKSFGPYTAKASYGRTDQDVKAYSVGVGYAFSKRTDLEVAYRNVDKVGASTDVAQVGVGLIHRF